MKRLLAISALIIALTCPALAYWQSRDSGYNVTGAAAAPYQGPGDIVSGFTAWGSCARAYNAAYANGTNSLCDLKDKTTGTVAICTLRVLTTGFVDLAASYCTGSTTPSAACAAAAGGSCVVSKVYDQTGNGNHFTQATLANMPGLTFSGLNSLPGMVFSNATSQTVATATLTQAQPFSFSSVYERTVGALAGVIGSDAGTTICSGGGSAVSTHNLTAGTSVSETASDNAYHSANDLVSNASSAINVDGTDNASITVGTNAFSGNAVRIGRCQGATISGTIMEAGFLGATTTSTQRNNLSTNQHSTSGYNF